MTGVHGVAGAFSAAECDRLVELVAAVPCADARLVGQTRNHNLRRADLVWVDDLPGAGWVMDRLIDIARTANRARFDFDVREFAESPQVARYGAEREGHFDWHSDIGDGPLAARRKLTLVVQLARAGSYDGGDLEVMPGAHVVVANREVGAATVFPSFVLHRVTPVTRGARQSLTVWAHGPAFR
ncbi:PKHD-type hydroxylase [Salinihabitans flavidus]|uniref:PKHD-type hydroxylase n=1 Tax=Salinihabitans flavidus TaxID=569882 RepID=A0A1H8MQE6_9RHOB|nr:2OG-Fe(II) oxygenase [Salinihabitans flavidus]SEO19490.1 PKHD-type hydroxylase [Salinihabitans flavidus]